MKILALELSSARGSVALLNGDKIEFDREWPNDRKNSGPFFEYLTEMQKQFGSPDTIIVGLGPGSYAGTRIAISAAIGLSLGGTGSVPSHEKGRHGGRPSIQLIGYPSICTMECDAPEYCVIGDARRNSFFYARICDRTLTDGPNLMSEAELRQKLDNLDKRMSPKPPKAGSPFNRDDMMRRKELVEGAGRSSRFAEPAALRARSGSIFTTEKLPQFERADVRYPAAKMLAQLASDAKRKFAQPPLEPMYLREPHITTSKR